MISGVITIAVTIVIIIIAASVAFKDFCKAADVVQEVVAEPVVVARAEDLVRDAESEIIKDNFRKLVSHTDQEDAVEFAGHIMKGIKGTESISLSGTLDELALEVGEGNLKKIFTLKTMEYGNRTLYLQLIYDEVTSMLEEGRGKKSVVQQIANALAGILGFRK